MNSVNAYRSGLLIVSQLVLETLYLGFLFYQVYKIVIAIVIVLCIGQFILIPYIKKFISAMASSSDNKMD
jgi:type IV secretory pathway TrbL component